MKKVWNTVLAGAASVAGVAAAADVNPGLWEMTLESRVPSAGFATGPLSLTQCFSAADARDPSRIVGPLATPGATGCDFTERSYSSGTFRFALDCQGSYGLKSRGSVTFGATSFEGSFSATGNVAGQAVELENRVSGKRLGDC